MMLHDQLFCTESSQKSAAASLTFRCHHRCCNVDCQGATLTAKTSGNQDYTERDEVVPNCKPYDAMRSWIR